MDRCDAVRQTRVRTLLEAIRTRMQQESPESLGAFVLAGEKVGCLTTSVMAAIREDALLQRLAPETEPGVFALDDPTSLDALIDRLEALGLTQKRRHEKLDVVASGRVLARAERAGFRTLGLSTTVVRLLALTSDGRFILQRRSPHKPIGPGLWDNLAAGLVAAGETPEVAMQRELHEEAGLSGLALTSESRLSWQVSHPVPEGWMREHTIGFFAQLPDSETPVNLDGEASGFDVFTLDEVLDMIAANKLMPEAARLILEAVEAQVSSTSRSH